MAEHAAVRAGAAVPSAVGGQGTLAGLALSRAAVDRSGNARVDDDWVAAVWADPATRVLRVDRGRTTVAGDPLALVLTTPDGLPAAAERYLLGVDADGVAYGAVRAPYRPSPADATRDDAPYEAGLRDVGALLGDRDAGLLVHAVALDNWHRTHTHCPRCGAPTVVGFAGHVRRCTVDGSEHYPRTDPAVIMAVVDERDRVLLGHQAQWPPGRFSTLAGFVEPGESLEHAVAREVHEETGITVHEAHYLGSQPWPFPSSLMLGFLARATAGDITVDGIEIGEARWFTRDELAVAVRARKVLLPPRVSIARRLIEHWYGGPLPDDGGTWRAARTPGPVSPA